MAEDIPNNPNMQKPSVPPNNKQKDKGLAELSKKMDELKNETKQTKDDANKNTDKVIKALEKNTQETKPKKKTAEELTEENKNNKKFLDKLSGMFEGIKKGLTGIGGKDGLDLKPLVAMWTFFKTLGKIALAFGVGALLTMMKPEDMKKLLEGFKKLFIKTKEFFVPIWKEVTKFLEERGLPSTVTLLLSVFDDVGVLFDDLKKRFKGFTTSDWGDRTLMLLGSLEDVGHFVISFGANLLNFIGDLFGVDRKEGTLSERIRKWFDSTFSPGFTKSVMTLMGVLVGSMTVLNIFGMPRMMFLKGVGKMLWTPIKALYRLVALGLNPIGIGVTIVSLGALFSKEILKSIQDLTGKLVFGVKNMIAGAWNAFVASPEGQLIPGLGKMDIEEYDPKKESIKHSNALKQEIQAAKDRDKAAKDYWKIMEVKDEAARNNRLMTDPRFAGDEVGTVKSGLSTEFRRYKGKPGEKYQQWRDNYIEGLENDLKDFQVLRAKELGLDPSKQEAGTTSGKFFVGASNLKDNLLNAGAALTEDIFSSIMDNEGFEKKAYDDRRQAGTGGHDKEWMGKSIGYGFNLDKDGAANILKAAGIDASLEDLRSGKATITKSQAQNLMQQELPKFRERAKAWLGATEWNNLAGNQQRALTDMAYNMGGRFTGEGMWPGLRQAIIDNNASAMEAEMVYTPYFSQVGDRALRNLQDLQMPQNQSGQMLASTSKGSGGGDTYNVYKGGDTNNTGGENYIQTQNQPYAPALAGFTP